MTRSLLISLWWMMFGSFMFLIGVGALQVGTLDAMVLGCIGLIVGPLLIVAAFKRIRVAFEELQHSLDS